MVCEKAQPIACELEVLVVTDHPSSQVYDSDLFT